MPHYKKISHCILLFLCFFNTPGFGQSGASEPKIFVQNGDIFGTRNFIENKGQFTNPVNIEDKVLFVYDHQGENIYFTAKGLIYELSRGVKAAETEEEMEEQERSAEHPKLYHVSMNWQNANPEVEVISSEKQGHYLTYGTKELNSYAFKKLLYKNVYDKIDIEYTIPADKEYGIKYNVLVHPGANFQDVRLAYSGDVKKIRLLESGDVVIKTPVTDITEHAPLSFHSANKQIPSAFIVKDNVLSFDFPESYNTSSELIIDPWLTAITTLSTNNYGYDVDYDFMGNTYVYGGTSSNAAGRCKEAVYNSSGVLQWTFSGIITTPSWNTGTIWSSNFKINKSLGKSYLGRNQGGPNLARLDANGNYDNWLSSGTPSVTEVWHVEFNCVGDLMVFAGLNTSFEIVSASSGSIIMSPTTFNSAITGCCQDVVAPVFDASGRCFLYFLGHTQLNHNIAEINTTTFTNTIWSAGSGYSVLSYLANKTLYVNANAGNAVAFNCLAVNVNYLYYWDGYNLAAYSKSNGSVLGSTTASGLTGRVQGGIAVDDCDNVYVGGNGSILCYHFTGSSFSTLTPIALGSTLTNQYVYDIQLNKVSKVLYVSGSGFVGNYSASASQTCAPGSVPNPCYFGQGTVTAVSTSITCANLGTATVSAVGGLGPYTYTWLPSGQIGASAASLTPGTYTVLVTDSGANYNYTTTVQFTPLVPMTGGVATSFIVPCYGATTATAGISNLAGGSGNQSYAWTNGTTTIVTPTIGGLGAGNYSVTVTDGLTGCVINPTFTIYQPSQLNAYIAVSSNTACTGDIIYMNGIIAGGTPGYNYSWTGGPTTSSMAVTQNIAGAFIYTLNSTDNNNCPIVATASLNFIPHPGLSVISTSICPLETATISAVGATTYTWNTSGTTNSFTASPASTTQYTVTGEALACTSTATGVIVIKSLPVPLVSSNSPRCVNNALQLNGNGGSSYKWNGPLNYSSFAQNPVINAVGLTHSGIYDLTVTAANGCTASTSTSVTVNPNPTVTASGATVCTIQILNLLSNSFPGATYSWAGPYNFTSVQQNPVLSNPPTVASGNYTVIVTSTQGCTNSAVASAQVIDPPVLSISLSNPSLCVQPLNGSPNSVTLTPYGANTYNLVTPLNILNSNANPPYQLSSVPPYQTGIATVSLTGSNGYCTSFITANMVLVPNPVITVSHAAPIICEAEKFTFNTSGATSFTWSPSASVSLGNNGAVATAQPSLSTLYSIVGSSLGCNSSFITTSLTIVPLPTLSVTPTHTRICIGKSAELIAYGTPANYFWSPPNGLNVTSGATITAKPLSDQEYTITASVYSCTRSVVANVSVLPLPKPVAIASSPSICVGQTLSLRGEGGVGYLWEGPGQITYTGKIVTVTATHLAYSGDYKLTVTDINGCVNSTITTISIKDLPQGALIGTKMAACVPFCSDFKFSSANSASVSTNWAIRFGQSPTVIKNFVGNGFTYCFNSPGEFILTGDVRNLETNCRNTQSFVVTAFEKPMADFKWTPEKPVEGEAEVLFINESQTDKPSQWSWYFISDTGPKSNKENPSYLFTDAGTYPIALMVKNSHGCLDSVVKAITIEPDYFCYVPNSFTPNQDGINEQFLPIMRGVSRYTISVFNRWGALIFQTTDPERGWDGTYNGKPCPVGVYVYLINLHTKKGDIKNFNGTLTLYR